MGSTFQGSDTLPSTVLLDLTERIHKNFTHEKEGTKRKKQGRLINAKKCLPGRIRDDVWVVFWFDPASHRLNGWMILVRWHDSYRIQWVDPSKMNKL